MAHLAKVRAGAGGNPGPLLLWRGATEYCHSQVERARGRAQVSRQSWQSWQSWQKIAHLSVTRHPSHFTVEGGTAPLPKSRSASGPRVAGRACDSRGRPSQHHRSKAKLLKPDRPDDGDDAAMTADEGKGDAADFPGIDFHAIPRCRAGCPHADMTKLN